jgi:predicted acetylornithine/succinylornithine family transaminase/N-acetyl-ornithine/N-acetyl-lysine deacetylase
MNAIIELENMYTSGVYSKRPVAIVRGSGALVWDVEGGEYIDCTAGYGVANIGHARPEIAAAIAAQAQRLITCSEIFYNDVRSHLLERLAHLVPGGLDHIFLCNSGTETVEGALKFARIATGRSHIVAMLRGFHGRTMGALSTTWDPHYREPFSPLIPGVKHIRYNDLASANAAIDEETAAVIIELVQGEGGVHVACEEYIHGLVTLCRERGALLIVDEVQTGFGRTGRLFACQHFDVQPDILCLAKSLAGGIPMGAICLGQRVIESGQITRGIHGSSFGGNPLACAAAVVSLDILEREALPERARELGEYALQRLQRIQSRLIQDVRGKGLLIGIELNKRVQPYLERLSERGVLALQAGSNVIRLLPPLVITQQQLDRVLDVVEEVLLEVSSSKPLSSRTNKVSLALNQGKEVSLLQNMLSIPSYSRHESVLAHYLVEQAQSLGLHSHIDEVGNWIAGTHSCEVHAGSQPIILLGHMDTVRGYIPVKIQDGVLYGRGAVDAKGPLAAFLCAAARLTNSERANPPNHPIVIIGAVEEESATSRGARAVIERYRPCACVIGEPSGSQAVTIGYKGRLLLEYRVTRSTHHSASAQQNANEVAIAFWNRVSQYADEWNRQYASDSTFASLLPSLRSITTNQDGFEECTQLHIGLRLPHNYDIAALRTLLEQWSEADGADISFSGEEPAFQTTRATPVSRAFISAIRKIGGRPVFKHKTGTSDMNVVGPVWSQNIVAYGPGDSSLDHTPHEHIHIAEYAQAIDILELVLKELAFKKGPIL